MLTPIIFSTQTRYRIFRHLLYWMAWVLLFTFIYGTKSSMTDPVFFLGINRSYWLTLVQTIPQVLVLAMMTYAIIFGIVPRFYPKRQWFILVGGILVVLFFSSILERIIFIFVHPEIAGWFGQSAPPPSPVTIYASTNILKHGSAVMGFASAILLFKRWWKEQERNAELQKQNLAIKLEMLQQQLHPHFLFNTLNNLYGLVLDKSDRAEEVVVKLSELLSYMLYDCKEPFAPLEKELDMVRSYLLLEKLRFEDRLDLSFTVQGDPKGKKIAPLILLPFLDNSFKHGVSDNLENPWINLEIQILDDYLYMHLVNSKTECNDPKAGGLGLENAKKRLELIYQDKYELDISETEDSYCVNLKLWTTQSPPENTNA